MSTTDLRPPGGDPTESSTLTSAVPRVLDDLGARLDEAFASHTPRRVAIRAILAAATVAAAAAVGGYALTRSGAEPAPLPSSPPAVQGLLARGTTASVSWELGRTACAGGGEALTLATADGSARTSCGRGGARPPAVFYDQRENTALVFGIAPSGTTKVVVADSGGAQSTAKLASARSSAVFVVSMAIAHTATALTAYGRGQRLLEACNERRCVAP